MVNIGTQFSGRASVREAYTCPPDSGSTVTAYEPLSPVGSGGVNASVTPALTVTVLLTAVPPPEPAEEVTRTLASWPTAVSDKVEPFARLSATLARVSTFEVAGRKANSCLLPLPRVIRSAATTGTGVCRLLDPMISDAGSPLVRSPRSTAVDI